jgi:hypothetical protein
MACPFIKENTMNSPARLALWALPTIAGLAWADGETLVPSQAAPTAIVSDETVVIEDQTLPTRIVEEAVPTSPPRRIFQNPPSRVRQGPFVRRIIPSRFAKPFNDGPYRYEPRLYDVRLLPKQLTLPGNEGERETLYSLPPRDRGYFILNRW